VTLATVETLRPRDEAELRDALTGAAARGARVVPIGGGGRLGWCRPEVAEGGADLLLSTAALDQVLDYVPGDGTLTAQVGCTMEQLARVVAEGGHDLTPDISAPGTATLGGTLGAGHSGLDRVRYGPLRHHVLGMRVLLADGTDARSGGKLVKNVTGFDLHRLYTGSRGTLCVVLEASLRLFPTPERVARLVWRDEDLEAQLARAATVRDLACSPLELAIVDEGGVTTLTVTLAGLEPQVTAERAQVEDACGAPDEAHPGRDPALRDLERADGGPQLVMSGRPSAALRMAEALRELGARRLLVTPGVAQVQAWLPELRVTEELTRRLRFLRRYERGVGMRVEPRHVPLALHEALAPRPGEAPGLRQMLQLRDALDHHGCFRSPLFPGRA